MSSDPNLGAEERARELWQEGVQELMEGRIQSAVDCFSQSLLSCPTAEGYTYRGWAVSFLGMLEQAVEDCRRAIRVDPEFGNPYNDIGVYMMQLGLLNEAIPWLEKAKQAKRYEPRHFPYLNLGRVYLTQGMIQKALEEFRGALRLNPDDADLAQTIEQLETKLQ